MSHVYSPWIPPFTIHRNRKIDNELILFSWGNNLFGELGDGTNINRTNAVNIIKLGLLVNKRISQISAGGFFALVLDNNGNLYSWGENFSGQLGDGTNINRNTPIPVIINNKTFKSISAGSSHSLMIDSNNNIYTWGENHYGQLGNGTNINRNIPTQILSTPIIQVSAGSEHSLALGLNGVVYSWGANGAGQLGDNTGINRNTPGPIYTCGVLAGKTITQVNAGSTHSMVLDSNGKVYTWGCNYAGSLGNGLNITSLAPVAVDTTGSLNEKNIIQIQGGGSFSLALDSNGQVYGWGLNNAGQLGDGTNTDRWIPICTKLNGKRIIQIDTGIFHSLALDSEGQIYSWGDNCSGQLGNGTTVDSNIPVPVNVNKSILTKISAGGTFSLASIIS